MTNYWVGLVLPDRLLLAWIIYAGLTVGLVRYLHLLCDSLSWFDPKLTRTTVRVALLVMLLPCVIIHEWHAWLAPAVLVLVLSVINQHILHLLSAVLSFVVAGFAYRWYRTHRAELNAWYFDLSAPGTVLGRLQSTVSTVYKRLVTVWDHGSDRLAKLWQRK